MSTTTIPVSAPRSDFPTSAIDRFISRMSAIVQYHLAGVGYADEHERLLRVTIMETEALLEQLKSFEAESDMECRGRRKPDGYLQAP